MSRFFNRILSFVLSVSIIITVFLYYPLTAYALPKRLLDGTWIDVPLSEYGQELSYLLQYVVNQLGAAYNGDFEGWLKNNDAYMDLYDDNGRLAQNISIDTDTGDITFSGDLLSIIKQALREYSEETNGLYLAPTINVHDIPIEFFSSSYRYHSLVDIVDSLGLVGVASNGEFIANLSIIHENGYSFVANVTSDTEQDLINSPLYTRGFYSNDSWGGPYGLAGGSEDTSRWDYGSVRRFGNIASERLTWDDGVYPLTMLNSPYRTTGSLIFGYSNGKSQNTLGSYNPTSWSSYNAQYAVWSSDGRRVRVWKNETAFIYGTENRRTVYFGRDFYNSTPSQITVSVDDLNNSIEKLDTVLDKLLDKIDGNTEESKIEDILQDILDEIKGSGGGSGTGSGSGTGGSSAPSGWYESVLVYLDSILSALEALVWIEADDSINGDKKDLFDLIDKIWKDPENGSQEAADTISGSFLDVAKGITKKFPFSIPWDIHALFTVFASVGSPDPSAMAYPAEPAVYYSDSGGIQTYTTDPEYAAQDVHDAPYFVLPLVIESYGINENLVIDLKDFQTLSTLSRSLFAVLFGVFLIKFTISLMEMFKGGADD